MEAQRQRVVDSGVSRTTPIKSTLTHIPNYPKKLVVYQLAASPYWWVRYYSNGKIHRRTTKETDKRKAIAAAKQFYDDVTIGNHAATPRAVQAITHFADCAQAMLTAQKDKVERGGITKITHENDEWRLKKHVLPHFGKLKLAEVDYFCVERFLATLTKERLSAATVNAYVGACAQSLIVWAAAWRNHRTATLAKSKARRRATWMVHSTGVQTASRRFQATDWQSLRSALCHSQRRRRQ